MDYGSLRSINHGLRSNVDRSMAINPTKQWLELLYAMTMSWHAKIMEDGRSVGCHLRQYTLSMMTTNLSHKIPLLSVAPSNLGYNVVSQTHWSCNTSPTRSTGAKVRSFRLAIHTTGVPVIVPSSPPSSMLVQQVPFFQLPEHPKRSSGSSKKQKKRRLPGLEPGTSRI